MSSFRNPKVSVIVPVCNVAKYLPACMDSMLSQSLSEIEIICINDGSTDDSLSILKEYEAIDERVIVIDKANAGYGAAMNDGLRKATGEYIAILESDDRVCQDAWRELYDLAVTNDLDLIRGNYFRSGGNDDSYFEANRAVCVYCPDNLSEAPYDAIVNAGDYPRCFFINPCIWTGLYRRQFLQDNDIWFNETPGASFQDTSFAFKTWVSAQRFMLVDIPVIRYTVDNISSSTKSSSKIYAVSDEMDECRRFLDARNEKDFFYFVLASIRYKTYKWNLTRISEEFIPAFNERFMQEMENDYSEGFLDQRFFRRQDFENLIAWIHNRPKVSVIIPVYNAENYLRECLDSVFSQKNVDFEVICVNDGSDDNSLTILNEYGQKFDNLKIIDLPKSNAGKARNMALAHAQGVYLAFLDADDYYTKGMLDELVSIGDENNLDIALCRSLTLNDVTKATCKHSKKMLNTLEPRKVYSAGDLWGKAFRYAVGWPWDKLFRRSFINEHNLEFQELDSTNDAFFVYSALALVDRFSFIDSYLVVHRTKNLQSIENVRHKTWLNLFCAIDAIECKLKQEDVYELAERDFINWISEMFIWNLRTLRESSREFYEYVQERYAPHLASLENSYFYEGDYSWIFNIWASCKYDLAQETFKLVNAGKQYLCEKEEAEKQICALKNSKSYRIGHALTSPFRAFRKLNNKNED